MSRYPIILLAAALACASEHENVVHVIAEQAPGLKRSARVQYRGVDVGLVKQVYFTPGGVRIDLLLQRNDVPIRTQDTVRITSVGAFGEQVVDIQPGVQTAPLIARGATLPKVQPDTTVSLPIGVWRSIVKTLGFKPDSAVLDSTRSAPAKADSAAARTP
jgi:phospholipid/cholesterol/gamma-HCH transport system substrate-binding protein